MPFDLTFSTAPANSRKSDLYLPQARWFNIWTFFGMLPLNPDEVRDTNSEMHTALPLCWS
jgi:hypothetical protein